ncbi:MAG: adenylate/guanylate cyclase domain-containing protein [Jaaginema sp. PMC 1079.18]|nr:adenylate/guanylate cyclase domain-containing protein [Jaaginema sp. PMC 1080.18]MEC4851308.1 adenylate/guanylate cyclase domain-containing protein [Jaaginema sp. PMC 1079.18]MEC4866319.1 adenylate/guanylate cyclase domain-containing protein [Jaaginema sp. PMC 1078.18]
MHQAIHDLLATRGTEYLILDAQLRIIESSEQVSKYTENGEIPQRDRDVRGYFPELYGVEEILQEIITGGRSHVELHSITRVLTQTTTFPRNFYIDLQIIPVPDIPQQLLLLIEDVTARMALEQTLVQNTNETSLLLESLEVSRRSIDTILESMGDALLLLDPYGQIKTSNRAAHNLFGYSADELHNQSVTRIIDDPRFSVKEIHTYLLNKSNYVKDVEVTCRTQSGETLLVAFSCSAIATENSGNTEFLYIGRDVTARQQSEQRFLTQYMTARVLSLASSIEKAMPHIFKSIGENLNWAIGELWMLDTSENSLMPFSNHPESSPYIHQVVHWLRSSTSVRSSPAIQELISSSQQLKLQPGESWIGSVWQKRQPQWIVDLTDLPDCDRRELAHQAGLKSALAIPLESEKGLCGVVVFWSTEPKPLEQETLRTLTVIGTQLGQFIQRKQAEAALQESEERYRDLFDNASDLILSVDTQGRFLYVNNAWQEIMGYTPLELQDKTVFDLVVPSEKIEFAKDFRQIILGNTIDRLNTAFTTKDQRTIVLEGSMNCRFVNDTPVAARAILRDITQRLATEAALRAQKEQTERLLLNILPARIVSRLKSDPQSIAEKFDKVTVLFADLADFTELASQLAPIDLVNLLNSVFSEFDRLTETYELEKIKTIGDAYMVVGGLSTRCDDHAIAIAEFALDVQTALEKFNQKSQRHLKMRIGIHSGPVVAGVIGLKKFIYDLWGDTVNVASRMESHGMVNRIQVTDTTYALIRDRYNFEPRGPIPIKGKGLMKTYWLLGRK